MSTEITAESLFRRILAVADPTAADRRVAAALVGGSAVLLSGPPAVDDAGPTAAWLAARAAVVPPEDRPRGPSALWIVPDERRSRSARAAYRRAAESIASLEVEDAEPAPLVIGMRSLVAAPEHGPVLVLSTSEFVVALGDPTSLDALRHADTVVVDGLEGLVGERRGAELAVALERLDSRRDRPVRRIGLTHPVEPLSEAGAFLVGGSGMPCETVHRPWRRELTPRIEPPTSSLGPLCDESVWEAAVELVDSEAGASPSAILLVDDATIATRLATDLAGRRPLRPVRIVDGASTLGTGAPEGGAAPEVSDRGWVVATPLGASMLQARGASPVIRLGAPWSVAETQRLVDVVRVGEAQSAVIVPLTSSELARAAACAAAVRAGRADTVEIPEAPLDVLARQVVLAAGPGIDPVDFLDVVRGARPFRSLDAGDYRAVLEGLRRRPEPDAPLDGPHLESPLDTGTLRARPYSSIAAAFDIDAASAELAPGSRRVVDVETGEEVASIDVVEAARALQGETLLARRTTWRIVACRGALEARRAPGAVASLPSRPPRPTTPSTTVGALNARLLTTLDRFAARPDAWAAGPPPPGLERLGRRFALRGSALWTLLRDAIDRRRALGAAAGRRRVIIEEIAETEGASGVVVHSGRGRRVHELWALVAANALEQATGARPHVVVGERAFALRTGWPLGDALGEAVLDLDPASLEPRVLEACIGSPLLQLAWRQVATRSLAILAARGGRVLSSTERERRADRLLEATLPPVDALPRDDEGYPIVPDDPLLHQSLHDTLYRIGDLEGLTSLARDLDAARVSVVRARPRAPSGDALALLAASTRPFVDGLDSARMVATSPPRVSHEELARLPTPNADAVDEEPDDIGRGSAFAWLTRRVVVPWGEVRGELRKALRAAARAGDAHVARVSVPEREHADDPREQGLWITRSHVGLVDLVHPGAAFHPALPLDVASEQASSIARAEAVTSVVGARLRGRATSTPAALARDLALPRRDIDEALRSLAASGDASPDPSDGPGTPRWRHHDPLRALDLAARLDAADGPPFGSAEHARWITARAGWAAGSQATSPRRALDRLRTLAGLVGTLEWWVTATGARAPESGQEALASLLRSGELVAVPVDVDAGEPRFTMLPPWRLALVAPLLSTAPVPDLAATTLDDLRREGVASVEALASRRDRPVDEIRVELEALAAAGWAARVSWAPPERGRRASPTEPAEVWVPVPAPPSFPPSDRTRSVTWISVLLQRHGVIHRRLESLETLAPSWTDLEERLPELEAHGVLLRGRWLEVEHGEQWTSTEVARSIATSRRFAGDQSLVVVERGDPLRVALAGAYPRGSQVDGADRLALVGGTPTAARAGDHVVFLRDAPPDLAAEVIEALWSDHQSRLRPPVANIR